MNLGSLLEVPKSSTCLLTQVQDHPQPPSWPNALVMYGHMREMPGPPCWRAEKITLDEAPLEPQTVYWHDPVECTHFLFQNLDFDGKMIYSPSCLYDESGTQMTWVYMEMTMGEEWHYQQVCMNYQV